MPCNVHNMELKSNLKWERRKKERKKLFSFRSIFRLSLVQFNLDLLVRKKRKENRKKIYMVAQFVRVQFLSFNISFDLAAVLHRELNDSLQDFCLFIFWLMEIGLYK